MAGGAGAAGRKETALRYGLPSEYTAYLVVEPNRVAAGNNVRGSVGGRREASAFGAAAAASRARQMRDASRLGELDQLAKAMEERAGAELGVRMAAGRLFQERDGVWVESASASGAPLPLVTVKLFSRAWFDLMAALPEVAPAARELGRLELAGTRVRLRVDAEGVDALTPERLATLVRNFRGTP